MRVSGSDLCACACTARGCGESAYSRRQDTTLVWRAHRATLVRVVVTVLVRAPSEATSVATIPERGIRSSEIHRKWVLAFDGIQALQGKLASYRWLHGGNTVKLSHLRQRVEEWGSFLAAGALGIERAISVAARRDETFVLEPERDGLDALALEPARGDDELDRGREQGARQRAMEHAGDAVDPALQLEQ
eukprot:3253168-Prymnesium_polylepis.2